MSCRCLCPDQACFMHRAAAVSISMSFGFILGEDRAPAVASSSLSSSIGKNSDASSGEGGEENDEAHSSYKGPLDMMEALEEVLPVGRGISKFYNYKSKSFTSLGEAATCSSIKEIAKPDNAYTRKRKNMLATSLICDKNPNSSLRSCRGGGISKSSKRRVTASPSTLALALAICGSETSPTTSADSNSSSITPQTFNKLGNHSAWRSLSLADLQQCATSAAVNTTSRFFPSEPSLQL